MHYVVTLTESVSSKNYVYDHYQVFLEKMFITVIYRCYTKIESMFLEVLMSTREALLNNVLSTIRIFQIKDQSSTGNGCQDVLVMSVDINSLFVLNINVVYYHYIIVGICTSEANY